MQKNLFGKTIKLIAQPFPFKSSKASAIKQALGFGVFVFLFLAVFQPFGIATYTQADKYVFLLGYGLVTTLSMLLNHFLFRLIFPVGYSAANWTVGKNIASILWNIILIGFFNMLYSQAIGFGSYTVHSFLYLQGVTLLVGIFPVVISTLLVYYQKLSASLLQAEKLNSRLSFPSKAIERSDINLISMSGQEAIAVSTDELLYVKALENYVEIVLSNKKLVMRSTLKSIEDQLHAHPEVLRCHRSYLVNRKHIQSFSGNAQGLTLILSGSNEAIPVSRKYVELLRQQLTSVD